MGNDSNQIQLGMGTLAVKPYVAGSYATGFAECGYTDEKGATFHYKGDVKKFKAGNVKGIVKRMLIEEECDLECPLQQFTAENFCRVMGLDPTSDIETVGDIKTVRIGGNLVQNLMSVEFKVDFDVAGLYARLVLCKCAAAPDLKIDLKPSDGIVLPFHPECQVDDAEGVTNGTYGFIEFKFQ